MKMLCAIGLHAWKVSTSFHTVVPEKFSPLRVITKCCTKCEKSKTNITVFRNEWSEIKF